jgi:glycosyltransferase involved in cell wall biosynthesis
LLVIPTLSAGGAEGFVTNLGVNLAALGNNVRFLLMSGVRDVRGQALKLRLDEAGIKVVGAEEHNVRSPINLARLVGLLSSWRPNIVQANMYSAEVMVAASRVFSESSAVYTRRLTTTDIIRGRSPSIVRLINKSYQLTIACSTAVAESYMEFTRAKKMTSSLITIPNGGQLRETVTSRESKLLARRELGIRSQVFVVAHIGAMEGSSFESDLEKGPKAQDVLLKAFASVFAGDNNKLLLLVGGGRLKANLEELARTLRIGNQVRFLGKQPEPWQVLDAADVFCFPSRREGLPNVLPEAASCGLPVVASNIPAIRNLCPGEAWLLRPVDDVDAFADALIGINNNYKYYIHLADEAAQGFRNKFSMHTCAKKYITAYKRSLRRVGS